MFFKLCNQGVLAHISDILLDLHKAPSYAIEEFTRPYNVIMEEIVNNLWDGNNTNPLSSTKFEEINNGSNFALFLGKPGDYPEAFYKVLTEKQKEHGVEFYPDWIIEVESIDNPSKLGYIFPMKKPLVH